MNSRNHLIINNVNVFLNLFSWIDLDHSRIALPFIALDILYVYKIRWNFLSVKFPWLEC